ncbi:MAG TPA: XrtA system polysaccharide chain length determinant [Burkholderiales bacterium]|nr:XrtA system polysaccharide chain length determinant [Burkholderiales bacterium]
MQELFDQLISYLRAIWRFRWYAMATAWLIALGGWFAVHRMPERYEASARVYVDTQSVLRPLLQGLAVQPDVNEMVAMMSRTLISVPNVEKVIQMTGLDDRLKTLEERERLVARLTKELTIKRAGGENLYVISYADKDRDTAKRVVESLLTIFVEGSLGNKRSDTDSAQRFIDDQLEEYNAKLVAAENAVMEFKRKYVGLLPGQGGDYFAQLWDAKGALTQSELMLREAENSRDAIKDQLAAHTASALVPEEINYVETEPEQPEIDSRIQALEQKLDNLRLTYTEQHPDIVQLVRMIAQLKEQKKAEAKPKIALPAQTPAQARDPVYEQLTVALASAEANVAAMRTRVQEHRRRYSELKAAVDALPRVEAEYKQLTRDYEATKARYDDLLKRRESAQISGNMEASNAVMAFRVIDPPLVPMTPSRRPLLLSFVLVVALGGGLGVAFLFGQAKPAFYDERKLKEVSGLAVLGTVVMGWTEEQKGRRAWGLAALAVSFVGLLSVYAAVMAPYVLTGTRV